MNRSSSVLLAAMTAGALLCVASPAAAQASRLPTTDWRQRDRTDALKKGGSPQNFAFEVRFGGYYPNVDDEFANPDNGPFHQVFGNTTRFYFGLEFDYLPLRIPYVGVLGPGLGWGWTQAKATANITNTTTASEEETSLTTLPMHVSAVLRLDELMRRTSFPVVPYGKFGAGLGLWKATGGEGAAGHTFGLHMAVGGALALNFLDPTAAARLDELTGVNHAYLFGEWMNAKLDGFGDKSQLNIGSSTWVVGLSIDM